MSKKRGLGRSLNELLAGSASQNKAAQQEVSADSTLSTLPIENLQRGQYQPRNDMNQESLEELAESIKAQGIIQPIIVRPITDNLYEIIAGERRWRAAGIAGLKDVPVLIRQIPDESAIAMSLIENIQRENLNPLEEAMALQRLMKEFEMTHQTVAKAVGKSRTTVTNFLRLLSLNSEVKLLIEHGDIDMGHAKAILALDDEKQLIAAQMVVAKDLSVRETENLVKRLQAENKVKDHQTIDPNIRELQDNLSEKLGARVLCQHLAKGKGKLVIHYNSLDELDGILTHIK